jgi:hypothetical protein
VTDLEKLTLLMDEHSARAARLGYALGYRHGDRCRDSDLDENGPEFRALESLGIGSR